MHLSWLLANQSWLITLINLITSNYHASNESPGRSVQDARTHKSPLLKRLCTWTHKCVLDFDMSKALHKDAKMRPFCKDAKFASKDAKTRLLASRWIRTPLYLSTVICIIITDQWRSRREPFVSRVLMKVRQLMRPAGVWTVRTSYVIHVKKHTKSSSC